MRKEQQGQTTAPASLRDVPMRVLNRPPPTVELREGADGILYVTSGYPFEPPRELLIDFLAHSAAIRPDVTFLAERDATRQWRRLTYAAAMRDTAAIATWLIRRGFGPDGPPVMILSENSIEYALLMFGALRAGAPVAPVSPAYSLEGD
ncbi:MAG: AMP-binding protein, partial [Sulfurifustis sp.]